MRKIKKIVILVGLLIIGIVSYYGYKYYESTYKTITAYAVVPANVPEKEKTKSNDGKEVKGIYSYKYTLTFVNEDGEHKKMEFESSGETPTPLEPNSYVKAEISKKRVVKGPNKVAENKIPKNVKKELME